MKGKWTIARQEACLYRGNSSAMGSMLDRCSVYYRDKRQAKQSVDDIIAKICAGNADMCQTVRKILGK